MISVMERAGRICQRRMAAALLCAIAGVPTPAAAADPALDGVSATLWRQMAENDVRALHKMLQGSHPGAVDPQNDEVRTWLAKGLESSIALARRAQDFNGLQYALLHFADGFNDGHVIVYPRISIAEAKYPGFTAALQQGRYMVTESSVAAVKAGSRIVSCDGQDPKLSYRKNVVPFHGVDKVTADEIGFSPFLFADFGNPFVKVPATCRFASDGSETNVTLEWRPIGASALSDRLRDAAYGTPAELGLEEWRPGHFWIGLPDFQFTRDDGNVGGIRERMTALVETVKSKAESLRDAEVIVFDVRGNDGGSQHWGDLILESIWGKGFTDNLVNRQYSGIEWRTSDDNIAANERYLASFRKTYGPDFPMTRTYEQIIAAMKDARSKGQPLAVDPRGGSDRSKSRRQKVKPRVILLGNGTCVSACNDFADAVLSIEGAQLWGADNDADAVYIENRGEDLPSKLFRVSLPMKVWRGRLRGHNEFYKASRSFRQPFRSTAEARAWLEEQLRTPAAKAAK